MNKEQAAAFAAMSAAMAASPDTDLSASKAAEMAALSANGKTHSIVIPSPLDILTPASLAEYLQLPEASVLEEANAGRIPGRRIAGEWRFLHKAITDWLQRVETGSVAPPTRTRPKAGVGKNFGEDPEAVIAAIYAERKKQLVGG
jgi:Helix-turn-helix domain